MLEASCSSVLAFVVVVSACSRRTQMVRSWLSDSDFRCLRRELSQSCVKSDFCRTYSSSVEEGCRIYSSCIDLNILPVRSFKNTLRLPFLSRTSFCCNRNGCPFAGSFSRAKARDLLGPRFKNNIVSPQESSPNEHGICFCIAPAVVSDIVP